jgi:K+-sensing histidine kinase KdpD
METKVTARILIVDDDVASLEALCNTLQDQGYEAVGCTSGEAALSVLRQSSVDLLLTDLQMPGMDGTTLLAESLKVDPQLVGVLMTGMGTIETAVKAMKAGALDYVLKPIKFSVLLPVVERALEVRRLRRENMELRDTVAIHRMSEALAQTLEPAILLERIAETALAQFGADETSILLPDQDKLTLRVAAVRGSQPRTTVGTQRMFGEGMAGWVAAHGAPLVFDGAAADSAMAQPQPDSGFSSALTLPLISRGSLIAVLNVSFAGTGHTFSAGQLRILGIFTAAAAASIEAAQMHESLRQFAATLERRVAERTVQLDAANRNLESFSYSVSHDLRQPLITLNGFMTLLRKKHGAAMDDQAQGYLTRMFTASGRMSQLIDDLLHLAKITRTDMQCETTDLAIVAGEIGITLQSNHPGRQIEFEVTTAFVYCDPRLVRIALENLLGNAWKFTGKREQARIEFGVSQIGSEQVCFVRDNGAGFDVTRASNLFGAFQRLHHEEDFPGTGIGLATVHRIVQLHGGRIWAEAKPDQGATFFFTLAPAAASGETNEVHQLTAQ